MSNARSWYLRTWGTGLLALSFIAGIGMWSESWVTRVGIVLLSGIILFDAERRATVHYLHPWLFFLLGLLGITLLQAFNQPFFTAGVLVIGGIAILLAAPYTITGKPSRLHFIAAILFTQCVFLTSLVNGTPVVQAALAVLPLLAVEELWHRPRSEWWRKIAPFAILSLILLIALLLRATYALS
jgi:hypothetical protein